VEKGGFRPSKEGRWLGSAVSANQRKCGLPKCRPHFLVSALPLVGGYRTPAGWRIPHFRWLAGTALPLVGGDRTSEPPSSLGIE
jgi:hypothetical protein